MSAIVDIANSARTLTLCEREQQKVNEISMFAENLGLIPPNTAMMVIDDGKNKYELSLSSSLQKNATVRIKRKKNKVIPFCP